MFQPQATPFFASYGGGISLGGSIPPPPSSLGSPSSSSSASFNVNDYAGYQQQSQRRALGPERSGGPLLLDNPTFAFSPAAAGAGAFLSLNIGGTPRQLPYHHNHNRNNNHQNRSHNPGMASSNDGSDDRHEQEVLARSYAPDLSGPMVGKKKSSHAITEEYARADPVFVAKTSALPEKYSHYRQIMGDGNCGWRAIGFSYFEALQKLGDAERVRQEIARVSSLTQLLLNAGHVEYIIADFREEMIDLMELLGQALAQGTTDAASLILEAFNDGQRAPSIIYYLRLLASSLLKDNREKYENFIPDLVGVDAYCGGTLESVSSEIDHLGMTLLTDILTVPAGFSVEVVYLDRSAGSQANSHFFQAQDQRGNPTNPDADMIYLLYRPGHYDILYRDPSRLSIGIPQQQINNAVASHSDIQVNRVASVSNHYPIMASNPAFGDIDLSLVDLFSFSGNHGLLMDTQFGSYDNSNTLSPAYNLDLDIDLDARSLASTPISAAAPMLTPPADFHASAGLPILSPPLPSPATRQFRSSKYELEQEWPAPPLQTTTFKNSHFNTAHFANPNFQPEEWCPDGDEGGGRVR